MRRRSDRVMHRRGDCVMHWRGSCSIAYSLQSPISTTLVVFIAHWFLVLLVNEELKTCCSPRKTGKRFSNLSRQGKHREDDRKG